MAGIETLTREFTGEELRSYQGRGGNTYTFIEDETVMDVLDDAIGLGNWQLSVEPISVADGIVKVGLGVMWPHREDWTWYWDFGYQNQSNGEGLKEAVSDGIRRVGRMVGVGRDLYRKRTYEHTSNGNGRATPPPARPSAVPTGHDSVYGEDPYGSTMEEGHFPPQADKGVCPVHNKPWRTNSRGAYCPTKVGDGWCQEKPR